MLNCMQSKWNKSNGHAEIENYKSKKQQLSMKYHMAEEMKSTSFGGCEMACERFLIRSLTIFTANTP